MLGKVLKCSVFLLFLVFFSCSQENNVLLNSVQEYSVESVEDGTVLEAGSSVNIVFTEIGARASLVRIVLEDKDNLEIASADVEPGMLKGIGMPLDLPADLEEGVYYLRLTVFDEDIQLYQDQRYFFVGNGSYSISSLETYPPGIKPGDIINARITLNFPARSDPWLRWTLAGEVLQEGLLSEMGTECSFSVPEEGGVYSLRVEVFPVVPLEQQISSIYRHSDLFVTSGEDGEVPWKFIEDRKYIYFIEFGDALINRMNPVDIPRLIGNPLPSSQDNYSGILFSENDGILFADYALPLYTDGSVEDFMMAMAFSFTELPDAGEFSVFQTGDELNHFSVRYLADAKEFIAEFQSNSQLFHSAFPLGTISSQEMIFLELSYNSSSQIASLSWMNNGNVLVKDDGFPLGGFNEGRTLIGSDGSKSGLPMIWYTFAVSSDVYNTESGSSSSAVHSSQSAHIPDEGILYRRSQKGLSEIDLENVVPGKGLASLVILSEPGTTENWVLKISDAENITLYSLDLSESETNGLYSEHAMNSNETDTAELPVKFVISLINDDRGFFLSSSADGGMIGPFAYQDILNIRIEALSDGTVDNIRDIRFFQD